MATAMDVSVTAINEDRVAGVAHLLEPAGGLSSIDGEITPFLSSAAVPDAVRILHEHALHTLNSQHWQLDKDWLFHLETAPTMENNLLISTFLETPL
jgi:hypothetical protein